MYFDGNDVGYIMLVFNGKYQVFSGSNVFYKQVNRYGGQDYSVELDGIKKGNKTLFKNGMPVFKESRIIPVGSIPYEIKKDLIGDRCMNGDLLVLVADDVVILNGELSSDRTSSSKRRDYHFTIGDNLFIATSHEWSVTLPQAREKLFDNVSKLISQREYPTSKAYLEALNYLHAKCMNDEVYTELSGKFEGGTQYHKEMKRTFRVYINGEDDLYSSDVNANRPVEWEEYMNKYSIDSIRQDWSEVWR